jgi:hypothetical protein
LSLALISIVSITVTVATEPEPCHELLRGDIDGNRKEMGDMIVHGIRTLPESELQRLAFIALSRGAFRVHDSIIRELARREATSREDIGGTAA